MNLEEFERVADIFAAFHREFAPLFGRTEARARGAQYDRMRGLYFYADYCNGKIWSLRRAGNVWQSRLLYDAPFTIATFGKDEAGESYVADHSGGVVYRMADTGAQ